MYPIKRQISRILLVFHFIGLTLIIGSRFADFVIEQQTSQDGLQTLALGRDLTGALARTLGQPGFLMLVGSGIALTVLRYGRRPPVWVWIKVSLNLAAYGLAFAKVAPALVASRHWAHWSADHGQMALEFLQNVHEVKIYGTIVFILFLLNIPVAIWKPFSSLKRPPLPASATLAGVFLLAISPHMAHAAGIDYAKAEILSQELAPNLYALTGSAGVDPGHEEAAGGRIGVLTGPDGVFMVDAQYAPLADKVLAAIRKLGGGRIRFLVDTHEHPDHTGGNTNFAKMGALIIAREETRQDLLQVPSPAVVAAIGNATSFTDPARLPVITYGLGGPVRIYFDGETIELIPVPAAHTNGDTLVKFDKADVIMIGDFYRNYGYPFVDPTNGGSFDGVLAALDLVASVAGPDTKLVPGHGTIVARTDIARYRAMIVAVRDKVQQMARDGKTLPEILASHPTSAYDSEVPGGLDPLTIGAANSADRFVSLLYAELKAPL